MAGRPFFDARDQRVEVAEQRLEVGRERAESCCSVGLSSAPPGAAAVTSGLVLLANVVRRLTVVSDSFSNVGSAWKVCASSWSRRGRGREDAVGVRDQPGELAVALGQRVEDLARVAHELAHRRLLRLQDLQQRRRVLRERREVAQRVVDVAPAAVDASAPGSGSSPGRRARVLGSKARKISSSSTVGETLRRGQRAVLGDPAAASRCPASARRRSRPAASSGAGWPWRPRAAARSAVCSSIAAFERPVRLSGSIVLTLPTGRRRSGRRPPWRAAWPRRRTSRSGSPWA